MANGRPFGERWQQYRPSKALWFWSCVACVALTMILGFTWGGWVTGGSAREMAEDAANQGRAELAATVCVERFLNATDASAQLASLKETSSYQQENVIEDGGWTTLRGMDEPVEDAADLCADRLAAMELPPEGEALSTGEAATVVQ